MAECDENKTDEGADLCNSWNNDNILFQHSKS